MRFLSWLASVAPPAWLDKYLSKAGAENDVPDNWAQASHYALGYGYMLTAIIFTDRVVAPYLAMAAFVFLKEFWFDVRYEKDETAVTGWKDMRSYLIGGIIAVVVAGVCFLYKVDL